MDGFDIIIVFTYLLLTAFIGLIIRSRYKHLFAYDKYFINGLLVKLIGGLSFALVYTFYYTYGGDTRSYFKDSVVLSRSALLEPIEYLKIMFASDENLITNHYNIISQIGFELGTSEWFMVKGTSLVTVLGFNNFFGTTILYAAFSYIGVWQLFKVMYRRYPNAHRLLAYSILFVPSVFFWGSGVMKDSVVICFLGILIHSIDKLIAGHSFLRWLHVLSVLICSYIIFNIKAYVIVSLVPAVIIWVIMNFRDSIRNKVIRVMSLPFLVVASFFFVSITLNFVGQYTTKYSLDNVMKTADGMQSWHYVEGHNTSEENGRGSSYTLGDYDPTILGTAKIFWPAVNVTFFRPYLWEVKNAAMLITAIESLVVLIFSIAIFLGLGFFKVLRLLNTDAFLLMALFFAIFFGFAVGFTSYNFGALARYKIPCMPFYLSSLSILRHKVLQLKEDELKRKKLRARARHRQAIVQANQ